VSAPTTAAGRDMLVNHGYRRPVNAEWVRAIEDEARAQERARLRTSIEALRSVHDNWYDENGDHEEHTDLVRLSDVLGLIA
jgi:hypothetical protein